MIQPIGIIQYYEGYTRTDSWIRCKEKEKQNNKGVNIIRLKRDSITYVIRSVMVIFLLFGMLRVVKTGKAV